MVGFDAVLLVGFGGPEGPDEVLPFLRRVTAGRGVPEDRLAVVARQYDSVGGVSPLNRQTRALAAAIAERVDVPVLVGQRNAAPFLAETLAGAAAAGHRRLAVVLMSAFPSYSGCRQYREDLAGALGDTGLELTRVPHYGRTPGFVRAQAARVRAVLSRVPPGSALVFTAHSVPLSMAASAGPDGEGYERGLRAAAAGVVAEFGWSGEWDLAWQSRSGPPETPWLEPDVNDHLAGLAGRGVPGAVLVPVGFISDHMEVVYDLDVTAARTAAGLGLALARAATVGTDPGFVDELVGLLAGPPEWCPATCCPGRAPRPTVCGD